MLVNFVLSAFAPFFSNSKPASSGNAATQGEVQGMFAHNNNTLIALAGPNNTALGIKPGVIPLCDMFPNEF